MALLAFGCDGATTGGTGGTAGTGGAPPPPASVDRTCRDFCANEPEGFSCFNGPPELVEGCYEQCLSDFQSYGSCGDEWIAIYDCHIALECDDLFGDCDSALEPLDECVRLANNRLYCEANCPELDIAQCEQDTAGCVAFASASRHCESACPTQDRGQCIQQYLSTGVCAGETDAGIDAGIDAGTDAGMSEQLVFVTSTAQNANFGGIDGANALCASQAAAAGLDGDFKAWLSTIESAVGDRLVQSTVPYVLVDGTRVADDWTDLSDGTVQAFINLDASGVERGGDVWTGTLPNGGSNTQGGDCDGFTSGTDGVALCGTTRSINAGWTASQLPSCGTALRLYCLQQ